MEIKKIYKNRDFCKSFACCLIILSLLFCSFAVRTADAFTVNVIGSDGTPINNFRWILQEDTTKEVIPGFQDPNGLSVSFHASHAPVVAKGDQLTKGSVPTDPAKRYFISVLPSEGYNPAGDRFSMGGAPIKVGQTEVTITVNRQPIPTAQISVFVFEDNAPINSAPDLPQERGLEGFKVIVEDAGGRYGIGGHMIKDAFDNPIGTVYNPDGSILSMGDGVVTTNANGTALIKNLAPNKYGIQVIPPMGEGWIQTSTIEGSKTVDAWVKAGEPAQFVEFGAPGVHTFFWFY